MDEIFAVSVTGCMVRLQSVKLCYGLRGIRPIRLEDSIRKRIGRPIRFEIRFEWKKTIRRSLVSSLCFADSYITIRRILSAESAATFVHAFVTPRVDYCNVITSSSTNCNAWWTQQPAFWLVRGSLTAAWRSWCMTLSIGLTCQSASVERFCFYKDIFLCKLRI